LFRFFLPRDLRLYSLLKSSGSLVYFLSLRVLFSMGGARASNKSDIPFGLSAFFISRPHALSAGLSIASPNYFQSLREPFLNLSFFFYLCRSHLIAHRDFFFTSFLFGAALCSGVCIFNTRLREVFPRPMFIPPFTKERSS